MDDVDDTLNVPVKIRSHEQRQLEDWVQTVRKRLEKAEMDERAETFSEIEEEVGLWDGETRATPDHVRTLSLPFGQWRTLVQELERMESEGEGHNRVLHLRRKLFKRVRSRVEEFA